MNREARQRLHMQKGYRTISHYAERARSLLDPDSGGRNLQPFTDSHAALVAKLREVCGELGQVAQAAKDQMKEA